MSTSENIDPTLLARFQQVQSEAELQHLLAAHPELQPLVEQIAKHATEEMLRLFYEWMDTETWEDCQDYLEQHPELLSDMAEQPIAWMLQQAQRQNETEVAQMMQEHLTLLRRCREVGIAQAFAEHQPASATSAPPVSSLESLDSDLHARLQQAAQSSPEELQHLLEAHPELQSILDSMLQQAIQQPAQLTELVLEWLSTDSWDASQAYLEQHAELLSAEAEKTLEAMLHLAQHNAEATQQIGHHLTLLRRCREVGIAQAFAEHHAAPPSASRAAGEVTQATINAVLALVQPATSTARQRLVEEQQTVLLTDAADYALAFAAQQAHQQNDSASAQVFDECRALLSRCREVGIAQAFAEYYPAPSTN